jgi:hypothetical protein
VSVGPVDCGNCDDRGCSMCLPLEAFDAAGRELHVRVVRRDNVAPPVVHEHTSYCVIVLPPDEALPHARRYARPHHLGRRAALGRVHHDVPRRGVHLRTPRRGRRRAGDAAGAEHDLQGRARRVRAARGVAVIVLCTHCGTQLETPATPCAVCESEPPSGMARFAAAFCASLNRGATLDEAAADAAPIARSTVEA